MLDCRNFDFIPSDPFPPGVVSNPFEPGSLRRASFSLLPVASADMSCLAIIHGLTKSGLRVLSLCEITMIASAVGAPRNCFPIAVLTDPPWVLAYTGWFEIETASLGRPSMLLHLFGPDEKEAVSVTDNRKLGPEPILKAAEHALTAPPLSLSTKLGASVLGVCSQRTSTILRGWNEIVTVRIDVNRPISNVDLYDIEVATDIVVNKQKDPERYNWHLPTDEQDALWNSAIKTRLKQELIRLCKRSSWKDDFSLNCQ